MHDSAAEPAVLDLDYLQENYHEAGFGYLLPEILELCRQQTSTSLAALEACLSAGDLQNLAGEAHLLKGTAGTVGAALLSEKAYYLELAAENADLGNLQRLLEELKAAAYLTNQVIDKELDRLATANEPDVL